MALVGKYIQLHDAYISVVEALKHGGIYSHTTVNIKWVDSETVTEENAEEIFSDVSGILVPGGFGHRGIEGKITAIRYARTHGIPFLGLCLGMQLAIVEFARNVLGYNDAHSMELKPDTTHPVIHIMPTRSVWKISAEHSASARTRVCSKKDHLPRNCTAQERSASATATAMK